MSNKIPLGRSTSKGSCQEGRCSERPEAHRCGSDLRGHDPPQGKSMFKGDVQMLNWSLLGPAPWRGWRESGLGAHLALPPIGHWHSFWWQQWGRPPAEHHEKDIKVFFKSRGHFFLSTSPNSIHLSPQPLLLNITTVVRGSFSSSLHCLLNEKQHEMKGLCAWTNAVYNMET